MVRIEKRHALKPLAAVPLCLTLFCYYLMPNSQTHKSVAELFCQLIFGAINMEDERVYLLAVENIAFIMLFNIMFTGYITSHFRYSCVYVFSRIHSRKGWYTARVTEIIIYAALYAFLYVVSVVLICINCTGKLPEYIAVYRMIIVFVFTFLILVNTTLLINIIALRFGTAPGFFIVQIINFALISLLLATYENRIMVILNPLSCLNLFNQGLNTGWLTALNNLIIFIAIFIFGRHYVNKYDVAMFDAEVN